MTLHLDKLSSDEFGKLAKVIYDLTGIHLAEEKLTLLSNRLRRRIRALGLPSFEAYYQLICDTTGIEQELPHFLSAVTTNETYFFRNDQLWKMFASYLIPYFGEGHTSKTKGRALRIWSAASSSGEEAYTAAIVLKDHFPSASAWDIQILGTDISSKVLDVAKAGIYNDYAVSKLTSDQIDRWFDRKDGSYVIKPEIKRQVKFQFHNLREPMVPGGFDLIFLRNVLMYFDTAMKLRVLANVSSALLPGGHLVIGDVDPIRTVPELNSAMTLEYQRPGLYRKPGGREAVVVGNGGHTRGHQS